MSGDRDPVLFPGSVHPLLPMTRRVPPSRIEREPVPARTAFTTTFTVAKSFSLDGRPFAKGEVLKGDDPVARVVLDKRPDLLFVTTRKKEV